METLKVFITLLALINPFGAIPMFLSLTAGQSARERHSTINTAAVATAIELGLRRGAETVWVPGVLRLVTAALRHAPRALFRRLPF